MALSTSRPHLLSGLAVVPGFVWWLGWQPGFATTDTVDQMTQARTEQYMTNHPPVHTLFLDLVSLDATRPGLVTLVQLVVFAALLIYGSKRLIDAGVPPWLTVVAALLLGISPAIGPTTLALWKDIPFGLFLLWAWIELLGLAISKPDSNWPWVRLGIALAGVWSFRGNGPITVGIIVIVLVAWFRRRLVGPSTAIGILSLIVLITLGPLNWLLDVEGSGTEPAQVFLPDVAGSFNREPETFTDADLALMETLAPLELWQARYDCYHSTPLLFDPGFDIAPIAANPRPYRDLEVDVLLRDPDSVLEHRLCAGNFVYWPPQPEDVIFHRLPYFMPENDLGLDRSPVLTAAFLTTDSIWHWAESEAVIWLTWRPATFVLPALAAIAIFAVRRRVFLLPSILFLAHVVNVVATSPGQEFRYAYPLYLIALLTIPLAYPALRRLDHAGT